MSAPASTLGRALRDVRATVPLALCVLLSSCSGSPTEQIGAVCADVHKKVDGNPTVQGHDTAREILPTLDADLAAARDARVKLGEIKPASDQDLPRHNEFISQWDQLIGSTQKLRDIWQDPTQGQGWRFGADVVYVLRISVEDSRVKDARHTLTDAANKYGVPNCADIRWHGGLDR